MNLCKNLVVKWGDADQKIVQSSSVTANDRTKPANDHRTCTKMSKPSGEAIDKGRSTA
jgi:hypothetical protein